MQRKHVRNLLEDCSRENIKVVLHGYDQWQENNRMGKDSGTIHLGMYEREC